MSYILSSLWKGLKWHIGNVWWLLKLVWVNISIDKQCLTHYWLANARIHCIVCTQKPSRNHYNHFQTFCTHTGLGVALAERRRELRCQYISTLYGFFYTLKHSSQYLIFRLWYYAIVLYWNSSMSIFISSPFDYELSRQI